MVIKQLTINEFKMFANNFEQYSVYQTPEYAFTMQGQGFENLIIGLVDSNNNIIAATILLVEKNLAFKYAYAPRGFLIDYNDFDLLKKFTNLLKKYLSKLDIVAVKLNPSILKKIHNKKNGQFIENQNYNSFFMNLRKLGYHHYGYNYFFEALKPRYEAVIDLNKPYHVLFSNIAKEYRTKIRSAEKNGIRVYKGNKEDLKYMYFHSKKQLPEDATYFNDIFNSFNQSNMVEFYYAKLDTAIHLKETQKGYHNAEKDSKFVNNLILTNPRKSAGKLINRKIYYDNLLSSYNKKLAHATKLLQNHPDGIILASVMIIKYRDTVYIIMDGYDPKYKRFNAKHLIIWKLMEKYSKLGYQKFNIGGVSNINLEQNKYEGLNNFKIKFNAYIHEYAGDFEIITNNTKYFMYKNTLPIKNILKK